jgi:hypothetical protein
MPEYPITINQIPSTVCYPSTPQGLLNNLAEYITVNIDEVKQTYVVSSSAPSSINEDKPWFQTYSPTTDYGLPKVIRLYSDGKWKEFAQLKQGDMVLVQANKTIESPWGEGGYTYSFGDTNMPNYSPSYGPTAPDGFKYKTYVGYWTTKS